MAIPPTQVDALILGEHPSAYLAAGVLCQGGKLNIFHSTLPDSRPVERLVIVNPKFFSLHKTLEPLRRKIKSTAVYGLRFLGDQPSDQSEFRGKATVASICSDRHIRQVMADWTQKSGVRMVRPRTLEIGLPDEQGVRVMMDGRPIHARVLGVSDELPPGLRRPLGIADAWSRNLLHRYSFITLPMKTADRAGRPTIPMSLELNNTPAWAWMLPGQGQVQLAIQQPLESVNQANPCDLLRHWASLLGHHGLLQQSQSLPLDHIQSLDFPAAAALEVDGVANRTLLIGPAGGFFSATGEDIYPNCWSAIFAADVIRKALKQPHLQDALQSFRNLWRTTLGEYLRGPPHNLRLLLPLVYHNPAMTTRLAESILQGKNIVR
jgi:hypothetical protein